MKTLKSALLAGAMMLAGMTTAGSVAHAENGQKPQYGGSLEIGTVYVTLGRMADKGYVESRQVPGTEGTGGLPRRLFQATGYGARVLHAWELASSALAFGAAP